MPLRCYQTLSPPVHTLGSKNTTTTTETASSLSLDHRNTNAVSLSYAGSEPAWHCAFDQHGTWLAAAYGAPSPCIRVWKCTGSNNNNSVGQISNNNNSSNNNNNNSEWVLHSTLTGVHLRTVRYLSFAPMPESSSLAILASASFDGTVGLWEYRNHDTSSTSTWECTTQLEGHENEVKCVEWNATGTLLATCGRDKTVWIWEVTLPGTMGSSAVVTDNHNTSNTSSRPPPPPRQLQQQDDSDIQVECLAVLQGHTGDVKCVRFAPSHGEWGDGDDILLSSSYDGTIKCWAEDAGDWYCAATLPPIRSGTTAKPEASNANNNTIVNVSTVWCMAVSPGAGRLIAASDDGSLAIYKAYTSTEKKEKFPEEDLNRNGLWKCVGTLPHAHGGGGRNEDDDDVGDTRIDPDTSSTTTDVTTSTIYSVDYAPSRAGHGRLVSAGSDGRIQIYREAPASLSDAPRFSLEESVLTSAAAAAAVHDRHHQPQDSEEVNCVCWHPRDGSILASAGDSGAIQLWKYVP